MTKPDPSRGDSSVNTPSDAHFKIEQDDEGNWIAVTPQMRVTVAADVEHWEDPDPGKAPHGQPLFHRRMQQPMANPPVRRGVLMCELPHPDGGEPYRLYFRWNSVVITRQRLSP